MVNRVTYRRQVTYNTRSNKIRKVKTPGIFYKLNKFSKVESLLPSIIKRKQALLNVVLLDKFLEELKE